jgi:hypothetical protein
MLNTNRFSQKLAFIITIAACLLIWPGKLQSQTRINSPYSMLGPGEIRGYEYYRNLGMGGIAQGFRSNLSVNYLNPASYTALDSLSFVFEGTVFSHIYQQKLSDQEQTTLYTNLGNLNFAFPVTRRWSVAAGLLPWSQLGYKISDFQDDEATGRVNYQYEGNGGINQIYLGNAIRLAEGLSAGINVSYLFGRTENKRIAYSDSVGFFRTSWSTADETSGFMLTYGLQWQIKINETSNLTLGATYTGLTKLDINQNSFVLRALTVVDTLQKSDDRKGQMDIPAHIAAGAFMRFNSQWAVGFDYQTQNWNDYKTFDQTYNLNNAYQMKLGAVFNPKVETYSSYFNRIEYRAGIRYGQSYLKWADAAGVYQDFTELGISFGIALPIRRSLSGLNLGFEYSQRNSPSSDLINENYFRFNIGVNVYERWFVKRKFY